MLPYPTENLMDKRKQKYMINGIYGWRYELQIDHIVNGLVTMIANCKEFRKEIDRGAVYLVDGTSRCAWNDGIDDKYVPSGYVILAVIKLGPKELPTGVPCGNKHVGLL